MSKHAATDSTQPQTKAVTLQTPCLPASMMRRSNWSWMLFGASEVNVSVTEWKKGVIVRSTKGMSARFFAVSRSACTCEPYLSLRNRWCICVSGTICVFIKK